MDTTQDIATSPFPDVASTPSSPEAARSSLETLRADRAAGRIGQDVFLSRSEYLHRVIGGEKVAATDPYATTQEQRFEQQWDEAMQPGDPASFRFEYEPGFEHTPQTLELDRELRGALNASGIPQHLGGALFEAVDRMVSRFENADEGTRQAQCDHVATHLRNRWGDQFAQRLDAVDALITEIAGKSKIVADIIDNTPWVLSDIRVMEWLDQVAQHTRRKVKR